MLIDSGMALCYIHRIMPSIMQSAHRQALQHRARQQSGLPAPRASRQAGKMLVPMLGVLAAIAMGVAAVAVVMQMQERERRQAKERELHLAVAENDDLKARMDELQQSKTRVEDDLIRVRKDLAQSQDELVSAIEKQEALSRAVEDREKEIGRISRDLEQAHSESKQAAAQLTEAQSERETLKLQLADLERAKTDLESKLTDLTNRPTVELDKVTVNGDEPVSSVSPSPFVPMATTGAGGPNGQVVVVNREYDFIVMNLGKNHGLSVGQEFQVVRDNQILGRVKVEKVYDELSAAAILPESQKDSIQEGDTVKAL